MTPGGPVRLRSCNTDCQLDGDSCFAEELGNASGADVIVSKDPLFIESETDPEGCRKSCRQCK